MADSQLTPKEIEEKLVTEQSKKLEEIKNLTPEQLAEKVNVIFNHHYRTVCHLIDKTLSGKEAKRVLKLALYYPFEGHRLKPVSEDEKAVLLHAYKCVDAKSAMLVDTYFKAMVQSEVAQNMSQAENLAQNSSEPKNETNGEVNGKE